MGTDLINKVLRFGEGRTMKQRFARVARIGALEPRMQDLSDQGLRDLADELRGRVAEGASLDSVLEETFALVRETGWRTMGMRHYDVQLVGAMVLHEGKVSEMKTGEGKTLAATPAVVLNSLTGRGVHVVTVNDYLARRDAQWMSPIYDALGVSIGVIEAMMPEDQRRAAYAADVTHGTNSEFGFDYLRDNMASRLEDCVQRGHYFGIVDEVDSILIDEARTPLIISGIPEQAADTYYRFARIVPTLRKGTDFEVDEKHRTAAPTESGVAKIEKALGIDNLYLDVNGQLVNHLIQALKAHSLFRKDKEYIVRDGEVLIVDEFTGRVLEGRRYSEGLHQAIEAKEGLKIREENQTLATITLQNYFRMYEKLSGMTGTASTEANEFSKIYKMDVVTVPTHRPMVRKDENDQIFKTKDAKFSSVVEDIVSAHERGQPVLVGTISVEISEMLSGLLTKRGVPHSVLNAKQHEQEAQIIKDAGERGAVTIATNMAGRGVDIKLGDGVPELGGLYVIGTERHESRRIDNQLRGRSGRQGDPGQSRFYLSAEDDLIRIFSGDRMYRILDRLGPGDDLPIEAKILTKTVEGAQKKVEEYNFNIRKRVLEYDDVLNKQREVIYAERRQVLEGEDRRADLPDLLRPGRRPPRRPHPRGAPRPPRGRRDGRLRPPRAGARHRADARPRALGGPADHRRQLARAPAEHGLPARGHPPARARPEGPALGVPPRGPLDVRRDDGHRAARVRALHVPRGGRGAAAAGGRPAARPARLLLRRRAGPGLLGPGRGVRRARPDRRRAGRGPRRGGRGRAAPGPRGGAHRAQRPVPVRLGEEVQEVPRGVGPRARG